MRFFTFGIFIGLLGAHAHFAHSNCITSLRQTTYPNHINHLTEKDVRVVRSNRAWEEPYHSDQFFRFVPQILQGIPPTLKEKVAKLFSELDHEAQLGRVKNMVEWIGGVASSRDAPVMSFICEAEYALYALKENPRYIVTFEPSGGFYEGHRGDVASRGMRQKSIDLRISDSVTGKVLALREVKSSASRANPAENIQDAYEKVRLVHHLAEPELMGEPEVEVGVVYFYDYHPNFDLSPLVNHNFNSLKAAVVTYIEAIQSMGGLVEKPFDTFTFLDFGSGRVFHIKRMNDDSLDVTEFMLPVGSFWSLASKVSPAHAIELRNQFQQNP
ncbi:MAG: hypothetical protein R3A80_03420 [Bdellovibrionota bacterium]